MRSLLKISLFALSFLIYSCNIKKPSEEKKEENQANSVAENAKQTKRPNVLIIYPDQLRRYSAGFWSEKPYSDKTVGKPDPVITPNMDRLAKNGIVFTNGIANFPLCSPSRGMLMTGMYPEQSGIWNNCLVGRDDSLNENALAITDVFYQAGYNTAYFGKCHWLKPVPVFDKIGNYVGVTDGIGGNYMNKFDTYLPPGANRHSIEYFYQSVKDEHYNPHIYSNDPNVIGGKKDGELFLPKIFSPKNEADKIVKYLQNENSIRDLNKPFFMIWCINPPHPPFDDANTDMEIEKKYYDTDKFPSIDKKLVVRENADVKVADYARNYFANVTSMDQYIGIVLKELEKTGALDNTIVILSSDHGEMLGSHHLTGKNQVETESLAVPLIVHWPKGLKPGIRDAIFGTPDIMPTLLGLSGLNTKIPTTVQGTNFSRYLTDANTKNFKKPEVALLMLDKSRGVFTVRYTLNVEEKKNGNTAPVIFMYDNLKDPYQLNKIIVKSDSETAKALLIQLGKLLKKNNDPWFKNKKYKDIIPYPAD